MAINVAVSELRKFSTELNEMIGQTDDYHKKINNNVSNINANVHDDYNLAVEMNKVLELFTNQIAACKNYSNQLVEMLNGVINATDAASSQASQSLEQLYNSISYVSF